MNLFEEYNNIVEGLNNLKLESLHVNNGGNTPYAVSDLRRLRTVIDNLNNISYLQTDLVKLKNNWLYSSSNDSAQIASAQKVELEQLLKSLQIKLEVLKSIVEETSFANQEDLLFIKLPELNSFDDLAKTANELKKGIELPILQEDIKGKVEILSADHGSVVLYVALGTVLAVKLVAGICWAAAVIRKKSAEADIFIQHAKTLELKNDALSSIVSAQEQQIKNVLEAEAMAIANKHYSHNDPETIERLKLSINTISELIDKGAKILPMAQNDDIQKAFPDYHRLNLIESTIKQISENKN